MNKKEWYSVAEFAERVNRSRQYINKLTNNGRLQEFTRIKNHVKLINKRALGFFDQEGVNKVTEVYKDVYTEVYTGNGENGEITGENGDFNRRVVNQKDVCTEVYTGNEENTGDFQNQIVEILRDTIDNLERELQEKNRQLQVKDGQIEKLNQSVENLHAAESEMRQLLLLEKKERLHLDEGEPENSEPQEKKKKSWWRFK